MAIIAGLKPVSTPSLMPELSRVDEAVNTTVTLLTMLDFVEDEQVLREALTVGFTRLAELGEGRLYVQVPAAVPTSQLIELVNRLSADLGYDSVYLWPNFWVDGTEPNSVSTDEFDGRVADFMPRLAPYSKDNNEWADRLLHFTGLSYDDMYRERRKPTQLEQIDRVKREFEARHVGTVMEPADHRDYLVWLLMDLIRKLPKEALVLARGFMRVPFLGRRTVDGDSCVGLVRSSVGQAHCDGSSGWAGDVFGVGLSVGFKEEVA